MTPVTCGIAASESNAVPPLKSASRKLTSLRRVRGAEATIHVTSSSVLPDPVTPATTACGPSATRSIMHGSPASMPITADERPARVAGARAAARAASTERDRLRSLRGAADRPARAIARAPRRARCAWSQPRELRRRVSRDPPPESRSRVAGRAHRQHTLHRGGRRRPRARRARSRCPAPRRSARRSDTDARADTPPPCCRAGAAAARPTRSRRGAGRRSAVRRAGSARHSCSDQRPHDRSASTGLPITRYRGCRPARAIGASSSARPAPADRDRRQDRRRRPSRARRSRRAPEPSDEHLAPAGNRAPDLGAVRDERRRRPDAAPSGALARRRAARRSRRPTRSRATRGLLAPRADGRGEPREHRRAALLRRSEDRARRATARGSNL